jgi:L-fuculose-phosphate aldolase
VSSAERLIEQVAWSCRILAGQGYQDLTLGHVSARGDDERTVYIKRRGVALGEVTTADVIAFDLDGDPGDAPGDMHLETVLHTGVYKRRPDVHCVVHGHPPFATAFSATDAEFEFLTHDGVLFIDGIPTFDGVPELIVDEHQGSSVADALGASSTLLLRNHGVLVAERSVAWATLTAVLLERSVQLQSIAATLGTLRPIPDALVEQIHKGKYRDGFVDEYWDAWVRELRRDGRAFGMPGSE